MGNGGLWLQNWFFPKHAIESEAAESVPDMLTLIFIGGHPHVIQPITLENRNEYGVAQRVTAYSLGSFVSNQRKRYTDGGIIVKCQLVRDTNGLIQITDYEYLPYWVYKGTCQGKYQYHILPAKHAVEYCAYNNLHGAGSVALNLFYNDTKSLIYSISESKFDFTSAIR